MKNVALGSLVLSFVVLFGCATAPPAAPAPAALPAPVVSAAAKDSPVTMENLDQFLGRSDVVVIDLRNMEDRFNSGYIMGTENLPFFQFLEPRFVTRGLVDGKPTSWDVALATVNEAFPIKNYINPAKSVVFFCASGTRAAFMKTILDKKGYKTYNAGGFKDYKGTSKVLGDGEYKLPAPAAH